MDDIRCPMCGKPNPAELDACQFCEARLKPLIAGSPSNSDSQAPDWLNGLRDDQGNAFDLGDVPGAQDDSLDWLARLGEAAGGDQPAPESAEQPDWLRGFGDTEATAAFETPAASPEDFFADQPKSAEPAGEQFSGFSPQDWFTADAETSPEPLPAIEDSGDDWLSQGTQGDQPEGGLPDWLSQSADQDQAAAAPAFDASGLFDETKTPESAGFFDEGGADQASDEETAFFDWQSAAEQAAPAQAAAPASPFEEPQSTEGLPDWLSWDSAPETSASTGAPDWMQSAAGGEEDAAAPAESAAPWSADWLQAESAPAQSGDATPVVSPFSFLEDDEEATAPFGLESDWSAGGLGETAAPAAPAASPGGDEPDWLSSLISADSDASAFSFEPAAEDTSVFDAGSQTPSASPFSDWGGADQQPDWLQAVAGPGGEQAATPPGASTPAFAFEEELPQETPAAMPLEAAPDWISQVSADDFTAGPEFPAGEEEVQAGEALAPANLPGWLEAMRPVDAVALEDFKDTTDDHMETIGPLAGLRGALPVGLETNAVAAAPAHTFKRQLSEETNARLNLLQEMIAAETQPRKAAANPEVFSGALVRLVLFVVLMLAAIWAVWYGEQPGTVYLQSAPLSLPAADFQQRLSLLPPLPVVLVAVEAETAFSAEMDAAAEALLTFLAARRAQIVFVSTNTAGPILAEHYIQQLNRQPARGGTAYLNYINLGYLSGGPAGLIAFLNAPERSTPFALSGQPAWDSVTGVVGLDRFNAVVVLTGSSETARLWVEQAAPLLQPKAIPLLFSVSAQVSPILQPYYHAQPRQVDGILAGLPDIYQFARLNALDQLSGEPGQAGRMVDAYSAVVLAAVLVLLIGIVLNLISQLMPARAKERKA